MSRKHRSDIWKPEKNLVKEIIAQYQNGISARQLGLKHGVADVTITALLKRNNVVIRNRSDAKRTNQINENIFDDIQTEEQFYWLGFILADGNIYHPQKRSKQLNFGLKESDWEHLEKFKKFIGSNKSLYYNNNAVFVSFYSNRICSKLEKYGIVPRKSLIVKVPEFCKNNRHFWRGMIDGDGWLGFNKNGYPYLGLCGTPNIIQNFIDFAQIQTSVNGEKSIKETCCYGNVTKQVSFVLYNNSNIYLNRKFDMFLSIQRWML